MSHIARRAEKKGVQSVTLVVARVVPEGDWKRTRFNVCSRRELFAFGDK